MTNKLKKRARKMRDKTGMSYQESVNVLKKSVAVVAPQDLVFDNIIQYIESDQGLGLRLFPVLRALVKIIYNVELDNTLPKDPYEQIKIVDLSTGDLRYTLTERQYLQYLHDEGRCNIGDQTDLRNSVVCLGRRSGGSVLASLFSSYETYRLLALGNPHAYYGIPEGSRLQVTSVATDKDQAGILFTEASNHFARCSHFRPHLSSNSLRFFSFKTVHDIETSGKATVRAIFSGVTSKHQKGRAHSAVILKDFAHFPESGPHSAQSVFNALVPSLAAFSPKSPEDPNVKVGPLESRLICISSPLGKSGKFYDLYEQAMSSSGESTHTLALRVPSWEANPTLPREYLLRQQKADSKSFSVEFGAEFNGQAKSSPADPPMTKVVEDGGFYTYYAVECSGPEEALKLAKASGKDFIPAHQPEKGIGAFLVNGSEPFAVPEDTLFRWKVADSVNLGTWRGDEVEEFCEWLRHPEALYLEFPKHLSIGAARLIEGRLDVKLLSLRHIRGLTISVAEYHQARQRSESLFPQLFSDSPDGGAVGKALKTLEAERVFADMDSELQKALGPYHPDAVMAGLKDAGITLEDVLHHQRRVEMESVSDPRSNLNKGWSQDKIQAFNNRPHKGTDRDPYFVQKQYEKPFLKVKERGRPTGANARPPYLNDSHKTALWAPLEDFNKWEFYHFRSVDNNWDLATDFTPKEYTEMQFIATWVAQKDSLALDKTLEMVVFATPLPDGKIRALFLALPETLVVMAGQAGLVGSRPQWLTDVMVKYTRLSRIGGRRV